MVTPQFHFTVPVAAHLFLVDHDRILLLRRHNTGYEDGNYSVIAGHLDGDEEVVDCIAREAREEAGIVLDRASTRVVGIMHRKSNDERIDFFLTVDRWSGEIRNMEPEKCDQLGWFPMDDLPPNVIPYVREAITLSRSGTWFRSYGWE